MRVAAVRIAASAAPTAGAPLGAIAPVDTAPRTAFAVPAAPRHIRA